MGVVCVHKITNCDKPKEQWLLMTWLVPYVMCVTSIVKNFFVYREHNDSTICSSSEISWTTRPNNFLNRLACTKMEYSQEICRRLLLKNLWKLTLFLASIVIKFCISHDLSYSYQKSLRALYYNFQRPLRVWRHNENCLLRLFISNIVF